ncbi:hypothetical protein ACI2LF_02690 [Kribbella sp. NPDC020789]
MRQVRRIDDAEPPVLRRAEMGNDPTLAARRCKRRRCLGQGVDTFRDPPDLPARQGGPDRTGGHERAQLGERGGSAASTDYLNHLGHVSMLAATAI